MHSALLKELKKTRRDKSVKMMLYAYIIQACYSILNAATF